MQFCIKEQLAKRKFENNFSFTFFCIPPKWANWFLTLSKEKQIFNFLKNLRRHSPRCTLQYNFPKRSEKEAKWFLLRFEAKSK